MMHHLLYGQTLATDLPHLPQLLAPAAASTPEHVCHSATGPLPLPHSSPIHRLHDFPGGPLLEVFSCAGPPVDASTSFVVRYAQEGAYKGGHFCLDPGRRVMTYAPDSVDPQTIAQVFERVVAPLYMLGAMPTLCALHGSAIVDASGRGWCLVGPSGVGKSTTLGALCAQGARILSDDMVLVDAEGERILPGAPTVRLWQGEHPLALTSEPVWGSGGKRWFRLRDQAGIALPVPCAGLVFLEREPGAPPEGTFAPLKPTASSLHMLMSQSFDFSHPLSGWKRRRFHLVAKLHRHVPLYTLKFAPSAGGRPAHVDALLQRLEDV